MPETGDLTNKDINPDAIQPTQSIRSNPDNPRGQTITPNTAVIPELEAVRQDLQTAGTTTLEQTDAITADLTADKVPLDNTSPEAIVAIPDTKPNAEERSLRQLIRSGLSTLRKEFGGPKKLPPEFINEDSIAYIIRKLRNPVAKTLPGERPFSIVDIMANSGYIKASRKSDYMKDFPGEYELFRKALAKLAIEEILEMHALEEPDDHGESLYYSIPKNERNAQRQTELEIRAERAEEAYSDLKYI